MNAILLTLGVCLFAYVAYRFVTYREPLDPSDPDNDTCNWSQADIDEFDKHWSSK